jgi:hypothetical protein
MHPRRTTSIAPATAAAHDTKHALCEPSEALIEDRLIRAPRRPRGTRSYIGTSSPASRHFACRPSQMPRCSLADRPSSRAQARRCPVYGAAPTTRRTSRHLSIRSIDPMSLAEVSGGFSRPGGLQPVTSSDPAVSERTTSPVSICMDKTRCIVASDTDGSASTNFL